MERQYKDSGIPWMKQIPSDWDIIRGKNLLNLMNRPVREDDDVVTCFRDGEVILRSERRTEGFTMSDKEIGYQGINKGDIVIHGMDGFAGSMGISKSTGKGSPVLIVCNPKSDDDARYIIYYLRSLAMNNVFVALATGIRERSCDLRWNKISVLPFVRPSFGVQKKIADFIDMKSEEIDSLIGLQEQMIEKLKTYKQSVITEVVTKGLNPNVKLVPSGVDWIGEIPEGWKVLPIKRICRNITDGSHFSPSTAGEGKPYITVSNVYGDEVHVEEAAKISFDDFSTLVANGCQPPTGSVLLAKDGTVGRTAVVYDNDYVVLSSLGILTPSNTVLSKYLKYLLDSDSLQAQMQLAMAGSALRRITITKICKFVGLLPPLNEQQVIIFYLDEKCSDIDRLIEMKQQKIEKLKDYKKSVIYEAVTGKISIES